MSEDPNILRDEHGNPLTSIFHQPPVKINFWEHFKKLPIFFLELEPMGIHDVENDIKDEEDEE